MIRADLAYQKRNYRKTGKSFGNLPYMHVISKGFACGQRGPKIITRKWFSRHNVIRLRRTRSLSFSTCF